MQSSADLSGITANIVLENTPQEFKYKSIEHTTTKNMIKYNSENFFYFARWCRTCVSYNQIKQIKYLLLYAFFSEVLICMCFITVIIMLIGSAFQGIGLK